ncbi:MacB family efflux pump subunit [Paracoccus aminophilus]|uniref:Pyoverdine export ATP-binding/permease protein PvdT n=1 Tax=Paracoccus aminophilus JCM 7686 TaxID=1367847 RepID=S5XNX5_PARAH|nr:MacB family efflux pump subunit [Paracoccus aminophilus]AGT09024.1 macrolide export ATP-binding/permease protein [Paracoccus aminophilus JCM 7686]
MATPLIELAGVRKEYPSGEGAIAVLKEINLTIHEGEMVAIVGASGSGKSTLMNILGCLDRPTSGSYRIAGQEAAQLDPDALAALRRERFGFIFQRYHLLPEFTALGNVEIPAIYAGAAPGARHGRARDLLARLGMGARTDHRPGQLSGGQQQRVSIARALMNNPGILLADEPTGALDSHSGQEVLKILDELHAEGRTVIIVTHDLAIAERAERVIEISDGEIVADRCTARHRVPDTPRATALPEAARRLGGALSALPKRFVEILRMSLLALSAHKLRTFLTMLGIIIGIASVVSVVALGAGSREKVLANISSLGTNTLQVYAGTSFGDMRSGRITTLVVSDAEALAQQSYVAAVTPRVQSSVTLRYAAQEASAQINGVGQDFFAATGTKLTAGSLFDRASVASLSQDVVIDENTRSALFAPGEDPIGKVIIAGNVPFRVIGVVATNASGPGGGQNLTLYAPYTTVQARMLGTMVLNSITVQVADEVDTAIAEQAVTQLLTLRHGTRDFFIINTDEIRQTITATTSTLTLLIAAIAVISLVVGGIGVMNIMLVSVSERVSEIGVRMAVGARRSDIMGQFLIEAVLVCLIGGILGIATALAFGLVFARFSSDFAMIYSSTSIIAAFLSSTLIGVAFGFLPARNAARLDPVVALSKG